MIPLRDTIPRRTVPFVMRLILVANVAAFFLELLQGERLDSFVNAFAFVPARARSWSSGACKTRRSPWAVA